MLAVLRKMLATLAKMLAVRAKRMANKKCTGKCHIKMKNLIIQKSYCPKV